MTKVFDNLNNIYQLDANTFYFDLEKTPTRAWSYDKYETTVFGIEEDWHIQSVAWKRAGEKTVHCKALPDFPLYKKEPHNDRELVTYIYEHVFKKASILVGHNINRFDIKKMKHRFLIHGLAPLPKLKTRDTFVLAKKFGFFSNSLDEVCRELGIEGKKEAGVKELWKKCYEGDKSAWKLFKEYNKQDVFINELVDRRLVSWEETFPVLHHFKDKCPLCTGSNFKRNGVKYGKNWEQQRYACITCGFANMYGDKTKL